MSELTWEEREYVRGVQYGLAGNRGMEARSWQFKLGLDDSHSAYAHRWTDMALRLRAHRLFSVPQPEEPRP